MTSMATFWVRLSSVRLAASSASCTRKAIAEQPASAATSTRAYYPASPKRRRSRWPRRSDTGSRSTQEGRLSEVVAHELNAHREALGESAGDAYGGDTGQVHRYRADIREVHRERVVYFGSDLEGDRGRGRGDEDIVAREGFSEVLDYFGADLLGLGVVGIIVAAG